MCLWCVIQEGDSSALVVRGKYRRIVAMCIWWMTQEGGFTVIIESHGEARVPERNTSHPPRW